MSMRVDDGHNSPPDDDWFAPSEQQTAARGNPPTEENDAYDHDPQWDATDDWEHDDPTDRDVAHRHLGIVLAVIAAVFLVIAGLVVGRITKDSTQTVVTITSTVETPAATTPTETTPAESTPAGTTPAETTPTGTTPAETTPAVTSPATPPTSVPTDQTLRPGTKGSQSVATLQAATVDGP